MGGVFLSHASADKAFARRLGTDLRNRGIRVWIDEAEIKVGDSLIQKISEGIEDTDFLVVLLSRASCASEWVRREVEIALTKEICGRKVAVLPCLLEECEIPAFLRPKKYADFRESERYASERAQLLNAIGIPLREAENGFLDRFVFFDLSNLNDGFDAPSIKHFSFEDFMVALGRLEVFGVGVYGVESFNGDRFDDVEVFEQHGGDPFDIGWCRSAVDALGGKNSGLNFTASYEVPSRVYELFVR